MFLAFKPDTKEFMIKESIDGLVFGKDEQIEIHCDNKRGMVYEKQAGVAMKSAISESAILLSATAIVEAIIG